MPRLHSFIFPVLIVLIFSITSCFRVGENESSDIEAINPKIDKLKLPSGFHAEHLYSPSENEMGSWVSMTFDPQGRLITSDQYGSLYRMELPPIGSDSLRPKVEKLEVNMGHAQGLLWAFNSLYVMVNNNPKDFDKQSGLYRLQDTNNDGQFNKVTLLKELKGEGEHGPHSIILAPDGNSLFVINGNHTDVPKMDAYRVPPVWDEDNLFPLIKDPGGHATDRMAPGGWVANVDSLGQHWELYSAGYRNAYDLAINEAGDMFTFDSDMEWDLGTPWYRPTRICHVTSGSEYGWRTGSGKWSPAFPDNLPPVINMGQGSPTGVIHGKSSNFPEKYQKALYAFDWSFGIIYAIHLQPNGASYTAEAEEFISGMPLPLTDGIIGPDGAMYFMTGGRRLESDVYRVFYKGAENAKLSSRKIASSSISEETQLRREIEKFHGRQDQAAINFIWPHLKNPDRFIRFAARIALEHQPVNQWQEKILNEKDPDIKIEGLIALARHGQKIMREPMIKALSAISFDQLSESKQVDLLRAYEIMFFRMGMPAEPNKQVILSQLNNHYPSKTDLLNRQLSKVLIYLEAPQVAERTMALLEKAKNSTEKDDRYNQASELILRNPQYGLDIAEMLKKMPPSQQTYFAIMLSKLKNGWTPELREQYFTWFNTAFSYSGGRSYKGFIDRARKEALTHVPKDKLEHYDKISAEAMNANNENLANVTRPKGPWRVWLKDSAVAVVEGNLNNRDFEQGKNMFIATGCLSCHNMRGEGSNIGPDLTQLGTRFSSRDMLEHIIDPHKEVSDQYASTIFSLQDGSSVVGRLARQNDKSYFISQNPYSPDEVREIPKSNVINTKVSSVSIMPPGLINILNEEELKDLMAYLMAGGNEEHPVYTGKTN